MATQNLEFPSHVDYFDDIDYGGQQSWIWPDSMHTNYPKEIYENFRSNVIWPNIKDIGFSQVHRFPDLDEDELTNIGRYGRLILWKLDNAPLVDRVSDGPTVKYQVRLRCYVNTSYHNQYDLTDLSEKLWYEVNQNRHQPDFWESLEITEFTYPDEDVNRDIKYSEATLNILKRHV